MSRRPIYSGGQEKPCLIILDCPHCNYSYEQDIIELLSRQPLLTEMSARNYNLNENYECTNCGQEFSATFKFYTEVTK